MEVIENSSILNKLITSHIVNNQTIGLVPTMGFLHDGHLSLIRQSKKDNQITIVTIFVNRVQFNNHTDFIKYPKNLKKDLELLKKENVDIVFAPDEQEIYPNPPLITFQFSNLENKFEGKMRPSHFNGVAHIVCKLFHLTSPTRAYFGLKDIQQVFLIKKIVKDLSFKIDIVEMPTVRENSGLALSSRNERLSEKGKIIASNIYKGLQKAEHLFKQKTPLLMIVEKVKKFYSLVDELELEYFNIFESDEFNEIIDTDNKSGIIFATAAVVEGVRLIDNIYLKFNNKA